MTLIEEREDDPSLDEVCEEIMELSRIMKLRIEVIEWDMCYSEFLPYLTPGLPLENMKEYSLHEYHPRELARGKSHRMTKTLHTIVVACLDKMKAYEPHFRRYEL